MGLTCRANGKIWPFHTHTIIMFPESTLHCPNCRSTSLRSVVLLYQQGMQEILARGRVSGFAVGAGLSDFFVGKTKFTGRLRSELAARLVPPKKWSYGLAFRRWLLGSSAVAWLIFYTHAVLTNSHKVLSRPLAVYCCLSALLLVYLGFVISAHNLFAYPEEDAKWKHSFLCEVCGEISEQRFTAQRT